MLGRNDIYILEWRVSWCIGGTTNSQAHSYADFELRYGFQGLQIDLLASPITYNWVLVGFISLWNCVDLYVNNILWDQIPKDDSMDGFEALLGI